MRVCMFDPVTSYTSINPLCFMWIPSNALPHNQVISVIFKLSKSVHNLHFPPRFQCKAVSPNDIPCNFFLALNDLIGVAVLFFQILDGHNGNAAAIYSKDHLLNHVLGALPCGLGRDEWLQALPRALVAGFAKTDKEFQSRGT